MKPGTICYNVVVPRNSNISHGLSRLHYFAMLIASAEARAYCRRYWHDTLIDIHFWLRHADIYAFQPPLRYQPSRGQNTLLEARPLASRV